MMQGTIRDLKYKILIFSEKKLRGKYSLLLYSKDYPLNHLLLEAFMKKDDEMA